MNEKTDKKIEILRDDLKFYRNVLLAVGSGVVIVLYVIFNKKVESVSWIFVGVGIITLIFYGIKSKYIELEINELIVRL